MKNVMDQKINSYKLVVCMLAYNDAEQLEWFLSNSASIYLELGIIFYVFDSSTDDLVKDCILAYSERFSNIRYARYDSEMGSNEKYFCACERFADESYDYVWITKDTYCPKKDMIEAVLRAADTGCDLITFIDKRQNIENNELHWDKNQLFEILAWSMTSYGATVYGRRFLNDVDWKKMRKKYLREDRYNFAHVGMIFEQLCKNRNYKIRSLSEAEYSFFTGGPKKYGLWKNEVFEVFVDRWINVIKALPKEYKNKESVIKMLGVNSGILNELNLLDMRERGYLTPERFLKYASKWKKVSDVSIFILFLISFWPTRYMRFLPIMECRNEWIRKIKLRSFSSKFPHIYLYGTGIIANRYADYLDDMKIPYRGFVVSSCKTKDSLVREHHVEEFKEDLFDDPSVGIILGMKREYIVEVLKEKKLNQYKERLFGEDRPISYFTRPREKRKDKC